MRNLLFILILSTVVQINVRGQDQDNISIKGTVIEEETEAPVPGAEIVEKGTDNGKSTDFDGNFEMEVAADAVLEIYSLGYTPQDIEVEGETDFDIVLQTESSELAEVVVVGYGVQKKSELTSAVSQVDGEKIQKSPVANVSNALAGKLPGLKVTQSSGEPGYDEADINLRGFGNPLVVVDGVPRSFNSVD